MNKIQLIYVSNIPSGVYCYAVFASFLVSLDELEPDSHYLLCLYYC